MESAATPLTRRARAALATLLLAGCLVVPAAVLEAAPLPTVVNSAGAQSVVEMRPTSAAQTNVAHFVNVNRRARGLPVLGMSAALNTAAQSQANYMASIGRMTHTGAGGTTVGTRVTRAGYRWAMVGENIAYGQPSSSAVVIAWMNSPAHASNMFNPRFTQLGVGWASAHGVYWWCLVLARPG